MKHRRLLQILFFICIGGKVQAQNTWIPKANYGGGIRIGPAAFSIGTKGYLGTGTNVNIYLGDFWEWDQANDVWTQKANFGGIARAWASGFSIGTKGYITTGRDGSGDHGDLWEYDPSNNSWTQKANGYHWALESVTFTIGAKGYLCTGSNSIGFWEWDQASDTWTQKTNFPGIYRYGASGFSIGTNGYLGLGYDGSNYFFDFYEWDQLTNTWYAKNNFPGPERQCAVAFSIADKGYVCTGKDSSGALRKDLWEYDTLTDIWSQKANFPGTPRFMAAGFTIGNKGYVGTGSNSNLSNGYSDFYEYTPSPAGIINEKEKILVNIFPNPFVDELNIEFQEELKNSEFKLFDMKGNVIRSEKISGKQFELKRNDLPAGVYFYSIFSKGKNSIAGKIVCE